MAPPCTLTYTSQTFSQAIASGGDVSPSVFDGSETYLSPAVSPAVITRRNTELPLIQAAVRGMCGECFQQINVMQKVAICFKCHIEAHTHCLVAHRQAANAEITYKCLTCHRNERIIVNPPEAANALNEREEVQIQQQEGIDEFDKFVLKHGQRLREYLSNPAGGMPDVSELSMSLLSIQDYNRSRAEKEDKDEKRKQHFKLPMVNSIGANWIEFYAAFLESQSLHSDLENVDRIRRALKCPKILEMGGESLFIMQSYRNVLKRLDDQIGTSDVVLQETRRKLLQLSAVHTIQQQSSII
jgi:hypothetical protein